MEAKSAGIWAPEGDEVRLGADFDPFAEETGAADGAAPAGTAAAETAPGSGAAGQTFAGEAPQTAEEGRAGRPDAAGEEAAPGSEPLSPAFGGGPLPASPAPAAEETAAAPDEAALAPWLHFAAAFPEAAAAGQLEPEVAALVRAGADPLAAQASWENQRLRLQLRALEADLANRSGPGSALGLGGAPRRTDPFLEGLDWDENG